MIVCIVLKGKSTTQTRIKLSAIVVSRAKIKLKFLIDLLQLMYQVQTAEMMEFSALKIKKTKIITKLI